MESLAPPPAVIDVGCIVDQEPFSGFQKFVVATCFLLMTLDTFDLALIAFAAPAIAAEWHLPVAEFGLVFGVGLTGNLIGSLVFGSVADAKGRKYPVIVGVGSFGLFTLLLPLASSLTGLIVLRFLCGLGLGGVLPNCVATTSEFAPARMRSLVVTAVSCGLPLGSMLAGWIAFFMMQPFGWRSIFYVGGVVPLVILPLLIWHLPESIRFLALKRHDPAPLVRTLRRIAPARRFAATDRFTVPERPAGASAAGGLFTEGRLPATLLLWLLFIVGYLVTFLLLNWLPTLLEQTGIPLRRAIVFASVFSIGGLAGGMILGYWSKHTDARRLMGWAFAAGAVCIAALGWSAGHAAGVVLAVLLSGFFVTGAQMTMYAVTAAAYPTAMRSTGVGWASGLGRVGSIIGPVVGGFLLGTGVTVSGLMYVTAMPALVGALASFLLAPLLQTVMDAVPGN